MSTLRWSLGLSVVGALFTLGCEREERSPSASSAASATGSGASARASAAPAPAAGAAAPAAGAAASPAAAGGSCPEGRWEYDYGGHFLESLAQNSPGARVVEKHGHFVCTITGRERGRYECTTSAGGVKNVFEVNAGALPMRVTVELKGTTKATFESAGPNKWKTTSADLDGLQVTTKATLGGREVPMPGQESMAMLGLDQPGTVLDWKCDGGVLQLKPLVEGIQTGGMTMRPIAD